MAFSKLSRENAGILENKKVPVKLIYSNKAIFFTTFPTLGHKDWNYRINLVAK